MKTALPGTPSGHDLFAQIGRRLFAFRLWIGLAVTVASLEALEPRNLFGDYELAGRGGMVALIAAGIALRAWGAGSAGRHTRNYEIEAPQLATSGPYAYTRNPIYLGSMLIGGGMSGLIGDPLAFVLCAGVFALLFLTIVPAEEKFLTAQFGTAYREYCAAVPRWRPRFSPWRRQEARAFSWQSTRGDFVITFIVAGIYGALMLEEYADAHWGW